MKADLHMHSTASDGMLAPQALAGRAAQEGFDLIALTDHDSVEGIARAKEAGRALGMRVLAGVELSCGAEKEIHLLGYGFDPRHPHLLDFCRMKRQSRETRAMEMAARLEQAGKPIDFEYVRSIAKGAFGRPHIAQALVHAGHASSITDAFDRYLRPGKPGYAPKPHVKVADAIALIHEAGGIAVLAHPMELRVGDAMLISLIEEWKAQGLDGLEVYHPSAQNNHARFLDGLARSEGLLVTGGSDFHRDGEKDVRLGQGLERWTTAEDDVQRLLERLAMA